MTIPTHLSTIEREIRALYEATKENPDLAVRFESNMEQLADMLRFCAFTARFTQTVGHPPHTEGEVMGTEK